MNLAEYRIRIFTILGFLILGSGLAAYRYLRITNRLPYELVTVKKGNLIQKISATGAINPMITVQVGNQISGRIKEIFVDFNSKVEKNQILAQIDPSTFEAQVIQAEANLTRAEVMLNEAKRNLDRVSSLFEKQMISQSEKDAAQTNYESALAGYKQAEANLTLMKTNLDYTTIRTPISGVVISRNVDFGQIVAASLQSPTLFVIAKDLTKMEVNADVSEADIGNVKVGQEITFTVDAYPERISSGKVKEIRMGPNIKQNVVYYSVIASIDNKEMLLRPGMTANVWIKTAYKENVLSVPIIAVKEKDAKKYVQVLERREVKQKEIRTGLKGEGGVIEILSGLNEGEKIVISSKPR